MVKKTEEQDPRHVAREEELARQARQAEAVAESNRVATEEARKRLKETQNIETFGHP